MTPFDPQLGVFPCGGLMGSGSREPRPSVSPPLTVLDCLPCFPHYRGLFVLLRLLEERLVFAFHITDSVSVEPVPLCVVSNAHADFAAVFADSVYFVLSHSVPHSLSQASSSFI